MIPAAYITAWRREAPWADERFVEQDLVISRALVEIYQDEILRRELTFRGGTALYKLHLRPAPRYSEDIDLVQAEAGPIGEVLDRLRSRLDPWLGEPKRRFSRGRVTLFYRFLSENDLPLRLKIEINSREHFSVLGIRKHEFEVRSPWFEGAAHVSTYSLEELLGTKLRALYQRKKGRDLFDLWWASRQASPDPRQILECFARYLEHEGVEISRAQFEENFEGKVRDKSFGADLDLILGHDAEWDIETASDWLREEVIPRLPGDPWKGREEQGP